MAEIKKVVVIGSGVMGSGIAAHLANANVPVLLLDIPVPEGRNKLVEDAIDRLKKQKPAPLMSPKFADRIQIGNIEDDLDKIVDYDLVIEVVIEKLDIKQKLYERIDEITGGRVIVSSNTSSIPLKDLVKGRSKAFQKNFLITHFFNPPRYMRLLEIVQGPATDSKVVENVVRFMDVNLGKGVVYCNDSPAFIANRIGVFSGYRTMAEAFKSDFRIEEIDHIVTKAFGMPKTGIFGLFDLVGLDVMYFVGQEVDDKTDPKKAFVKVDNTQSYDLLKSMIDSGFTGRKGKGGFYQLGKDRQKESRDLKTGAYSAVQKDFDFKGLKDAKKDLKGYLSQKDKAAKFAWNVLSDVLSQTLSLVPEITDEIINVDRAIRLGFNWQKGPFELLDELGPAWFKSRLEAESRPVPKLLETVGEGTFYKLSKGKINFMTVKGSYKAIKRPEGVLRLKDIKAASKPIESNPSASLWDIGDGVACLELTSKNNAVDMMTVDMFHTSVKRVNKDFKALIIHSEADNFSVGANLASFLEGAKGKSIEEGLGVLEKGQDGMKALKFAPFPVISAASGMALGGGCEILLHSDVVVAHAELYVGLVEVGVGIVPGWGGCKEMLLRYNQSETGGALLGFRKAFELIGTAKVATSAYHAKSLGFLRPSDSIVMNKDRLLFEAKQKALAMAMAKDYKAPKEQTLRLPGALGLTAIKMGLKPLHSAGKISDYDVVVSTELGRVLTGGDTHPFRTVSEDDIFKLELQAIATLAQNQKTIDRMEHILKTGKPLRN